jgi:rRNA maturation protein Rpf1
MMEKFFDDLPEHLSIEEVNRVMDLFEELAKVVREERGNPASLHLAYYASYKMTEYLKLSLKLFSEAIKDELEKRNGEES